MVVVIPSLIFISMQISERRGHFRYTDVEDSRIAAWCLEQIRDSYDEIPSTHRDVVDYMVEVLDCESESALEYVYVVACGWYDENLGHPWYECVRDIISRDRFNGGMYRYAECIAHKNGDWASETLQHDAWDALSRFANDPDHADYWSKGIYRAGH